MRRLNMGWTQWIQPGFGWRSLGGFATVVAIAVAGVATSLPASAQQTRAGGSIKDTKHNLGSTGTGNNKFSGTAEICVFCHTPHGADTSAVVPLWNRTLASPSAYTTYDSLGTTTLDGKTASVGSVSIACLSCHDGVQSMSAVINAPGSGKAGDAAWLAGSWTGTTVQGSGSLAVTAITNLGTDLRNDHPIGIQYGGGGFKASTGAAGSSNDPDFIKPSFTTIGSTPIWWVDTEATASNTRQKTDMILYTRAAGSYTGQTESEPFVECASCHDPHSTNSTFLRIQNTGSAVCLSCHVK
jgi:predicted CXXCH cytochrome family protein